MKSGQSQGHRRTVLDHRSGTTSSLKRLGEGAIVAVLHYSNPVNERGDSIVSDISHVPTGP